MSNPYLEITYRQGKPLAAYLYLNRRSGDHAVRSERHGTWVVDFSADGQVLGIEFTHVGTVDLEAVNRVLGEAHQPALSTADVFPLQAA
jgi:hypothetical protein